MRAKCVNEKFKEESDPIKDMGIGITPLMKQIEDNFDEKEDGALYDLGIFNEIDALTVNIYGNIDHPMSGYNEAFYEVDVEGILKLNPKTKEISVDAKTIMTNGKVSTEDENGDEYPDSMFGERDYEHATHRKGAWKETFENIHELMDALRTAAE